MARDGVIVDTDIVIEYLRGSGDGVAVMRALLREGRALLSPVSVFELHRGARTDDDRRTIDTLCHRRTLALSPGSARRAGQVAAELDRAGTPIGAADTLIAGLCLHHGLALATGNRRHFERVAGLQLHAPG